MAKATEWVQRFETAPEGKLGEELAAFMAEIGVIATARGNTPNAIEGAVREQKAKFFAICARTTKVTTDLWPALMTAHGADYVPGIKAYLKSCEPKRPARNEKDWRKKPGKPGRKPQGPRNDKNTRPAVRAA